MGSGGDLFRKVHQHPVVMVGGGSSGLVVRWGFGGWSGRKDGRGTLALLDLQQAVTLSPIVFPSTPALP